MFWFLPFFLSYSSCRYPDTKSLQTTWSRALTRVHAALRVGAIAVRGFAGAAARVVHGVYDPVGLYEGKVLFQKREDPDKWVRWVKTRLCWMISCTADKDAHDDDAGWCSCEEMRDLDDPRQASTWSMYDGDDDSLGVVQAGAKVVAFVSAEKLLRAAAAADATSAHAGIGVHPKIKIAAHNQAEAAAKPSSGWVSRPAQ